MFSPITLIVTGIISFFGFVFLIGYGANLEQRIRNLEEEKRRNQ